MLTRCRDIQADTYYLRHLQDGFSVRMLTHSSTFLFTLAQISALLAFYYIILVSFSISILFFLFPLHILFSHTLPTPRIFVLLCPYPPFPSLFLFLLPFSWFILFVFFKPPTALLVHWPSFTYTLTYHCTIVYSLPYSISKHGRMWSCFCRKVKSPAEDWNGCLLTIIITHPLGLLTPGSYWNSNKHITGCRFWGSAEIEGSLGMTCEVGVAELPWARPCHAAKRCADATRLSLVPVKDDLFQEQVSLFCHLKLAWYEKVFIDSSGCHWLILINGSLFKV